MDADGKIIIAGDFIEVNGVHGPVELCVARLNADGTLDETFTASGFSPYGFFGGTPTPIRGIAIQSNDADRNRREVQWCGNCNNHVPLVRLNADGSRDNNYIFADCLPPNGLDCRCEIW